jgi:hypothetical protein
MFGMLAFLIAGVVIIFVLSSYVPPEKEKIAYLIVGNVLGWPMMVLAFHYGASQGGKQSRETLDKVLHQSMYSPPNATGKVGDPVHATIDTE